MSATFPDQYRDLFQKKAFGAFTTLMPDGGPQTTPVWVDYQDGEIWVNSAVGRRKDRNLRRDPRVAIAVIDPENPYRYVEVRGRVREITQDGADAHIDKMAKKYLGQDKYPYRQPGEQRVLYKISIEKVHAMG
ncbi:MAG: PPOX class F420-dependent oxidoreductase [Betaproteobacteria bacterium]|nr:PPOX class F420-dependent oxidoreductase [Betaproteobacteria bacterium]